MPATVTWTDPAAAAETASGPPPFPVPESQWTLDYMHARFCSPHLGRFLSMDPIKSRRASKKQQSWNKYSYTLNNPMRYVDPDGKCAVPAGLKEGEVGICIESFIAAPRIGGVGFGDNRGFEPNNPDATYRTSLRFVMNPKSGQVTSSQQKAGVSEVGLTSPLLGVPGSTDVSGAVAPGEGGNHHVSLLITGQNGLAALNNFGVISILANLTVSPSGQVTVDPDSATKSFPSIEGYAYRMVDGEVMIEVLFQIEEDTPDGLNGDMTEPLDSPTE